MIEIINLKIFTVNINCRYHWSKLPKMINIMKTNCLQFPFCANLYGANLYGADLYGANLRGANLCGANLYGADLRSANLRGANLCGADLCDADLRSADLYGANLRGANLSSADNIDKLTVIDFCIFERFGSINRTTYFYSTKDVGIVVRCGCFYGTLKEFKKQVKKTHKGNIHEKCYMQMVKLAKIRLETEV